MPSLRWQDRGGDAGTAQATDEALALILGGEGQAVIDMIDNAEGPGIEVCWSLPRVAHPAAFVIPTAAR